MLPHRSTPATTASAPNRTASHAETPHPRPCGGETGEQRAKKRFTMFQTFHSPPRCRAESAHSQRGNQGNRLKHRAPGQNKNRHGFHGFFPLISRNAPQICPACDLATNLMAGCRRQLESKIRAILPFVREIRVHSCLRDDERSFKRLPWRGNERRLTADRKRSPFLLPSGEKVGLRGCRRHATCTVRDYVSALAGVTPPHPTLSPGGRGLFAADSVSHVPEFGTLPFAATGFPFAGSRSIFAGVANKPTRTAGVRP